MTPDGEKTMRNVIGRIPGKTDKWVILGSHFDTMPGIDGIRSLIAIITSQCNLDCTYCYQDAKKDQDQHDQE